MEGTILLAGCGKMGGILLDGWLERGLRAGDIVVVEPDEATAQAVAKRHQVTVVDDSTRLTPGFVPETLVLAVKPQVMDDVVSAYASYAGPETVFLSIAAGKTMAYFEDKLGPEAAIVRAMPNTPAAIGRGITVAIANQRVGEAQQNRCNSLLEAVGEVAWINDEGLMDAVTAVSGSGPAYVFLLAEYLARAGEEAGLSASLSHQLARATVSGAGEFLYKTSEPAATLRANVTSPGGTTAAALEILMGDEGLQPLLTKAIAEATKRSRELAG